ncbi:uncharacterized protein LOC133197845 [Saccostrea echinata]|uniref:uncharacterized protein LOC133197845 n=1 Tax=Saccostrea echinata TaxID=191078 RepID=UPI002A83EEF6|nr:uncharacterized protein LOC133197845 [Saccostrea echinata]
MRGPIMNCNTYIKIMCFTTSVIWIMIGRCDSTSKTMRILETPNIKPLYLNVSESRTESRVTVYGRFRSPQDTTAEIDDGTIVKFDKVLNSEGSSMDFELVLYYDIWRYLPRLTLSSNSASEFLHIYLSEIVDDYVQTDFTGTDCSVGINRSSESQSTTYNSVIQNCNYAIDDIFTIGLNKSGEIIRLDSDMYCYSSNAENMKYFKSRCSLYVSDDPLYVTFYEDKMAADNVELLYLNYMFNPVGPCSQKCIANIKRWFFSII